MKYADMLSIAKTAERCKAEGIPLSEKLIRKLVKSDELPAVRSGKKALLYFPNVLEFVKSGNNRRDQADQTGKIRPLRA